MPHRLTIIRIVSLIFLVLISSHGEIPAQEKAPIHKTKLSVLSFANTGDLSELRWLKTNGELDEGADSKVLISSSSILHPVDYSGPRVITLCVPNHAAKVGANDDGKSHTPLAKVTLPISQKTIVLLLPPVKNAVSGLAYRAVAIDAATPDFKNGSRYLFNFTQPPIRGIMGETPFQPDAPKNKHFRIEGGGKTILTALDSSAPAREGRQIYIDYHDASTKEWKRMVSSRWFRTPGKRKLVFFYLDARSPSPRMKIISEAAARPDEN
ncbi:hypothetical protein [Oceaniferula spumae]